MSLMWYKYSNGLLTSWPFAKWFTVIATEPLHHVHVLIMSVSHIAPSSLTNQCYLVTCTVPIDQSDPIV